MKKYIRNAATTLALLLLGLLTMGCPVEQAPVTRTVTFNTDGGSSVDNQTITNGGKVTKPTNPTRDGYTFDNWYKDAAKTTVFDFNSVIIASVTLYAKWTAITYTVTFDLDGGTGVMQALQTKPLHMATKQPGPVPIQREMVTRLIIGTKTQRKQPSLILIQ